MFEEEDNPDVAFKNMVLYFWESKEDPTRYCDWDAARCAELMPDFYTSWCNYKQARKALDKAAHSERYST